MGVYKGTISKERWNGYGTSGPRSKDCEEISAFYAGVYCSLFRIRDQRRWDNDKNGRKKRTTGGLRERERDGKLSDSRTS